MPLAAATRLEQSSHHPTSTICPKGEAGALQIAFRVGEKPFRSERPLYSECDSFYKISVDVSPTFETSVSNDFK